MGTDEHRVHVHEQMHFGMLPLPVAVASERLQGTPTIALVMILVVMATG